MRFMRPFHAQGPIREPRSEAGDLIQRAPVALRPALAFPFGLAVLLWWAGALSALAWPPLPPRPESVATLPFTESWESGLSRPCWRVSGEGPVQAVITDAGGPAEGRRHLVLETSRAGSPARAELTLAIDLAGRSNVVLRFRARVYGDAPPQVSPPRPFRGAADFNGLALSTDGELWWTVCELRTTEPAYADYRVDLDAAVATNQLRYTSNFLIRFHESGDQRLPRGGIALDDLSVTASGSALVAAEVGLLAEGCAFTNGVLDPGERVTLSLTVSNTGLVPITHLVAALLPVHGVLAPGGMQSYGRLPAGSPPVTRFFDCTAEGDCGGLVQATFQLYDGSNDLGRVRWPWPLGTWRMAWAESFDAPGLSGMPPGWEFEHSGVGWPWDLTSVFYDSAPRAAVILDPAGPSRHRLISPPNLITTTNAHLLFCHYFNTRPETHGGAVQLSIADGPFVEVTAAGGRIITGEYTHPSRWSGDSAGWIATQILLPASAAGQRIRLCWDFQSEDYLAGNAWYIDDIRLLDGFTCCGAPPLTVTSLGGSQFALSFPTTAGRSYSLESKASLELPDWTLVATIPGLGLPVTFTNPPSPSPQRFFRLRID